MTLSDFPTLGSLISYITRDRYAVSDADWTEREHPRGEDGRFVGKGDSAGKDKNGFNFVYGGNGSPNLGRITEAQAEAMGLRPAPIRLSEGESDKYGLKHIEYRHGEQIRNAGYKSVVEFVEDIANNFDEIHKGVVSNRNGKSVQGFYLSKTTSHGVIGIELEPSEGGDFYTVNNGGIFRQSYLKKKETLWSAPYAQTPPQGATLSSDAESVHAALSESAGRVCSWGFSNSIDDVFVSDNTPLDEINKAALRWTVNDDGTLTPENEPSTGNLWKSVAWRNAGVKSLEEIFAEWKGCKN